MIHFGFLRRLTLLTALLVLAAVVTTAGEEVDGEVKTSANAEPSEDVKRFFGTWLHVETRTNPKSDKSAQVEHYLLFKWQGNHLRVKTVERNPVTGRRGRESSWNGTIRIDRWGNEIKQTFTPMPDGSLSVGLSGTNGWGKTTRQVWWAAGRLRWQRDASGESLHLLTTEGYAPSRKGNNWQPIDRTYRRVSNDVDTRQLGRSR